MLLYRWGKLARETFLSFIAIFVEAASNVRENCRKTYSSAPRIVACRPCALVAYSVIAWGSRKTHFTFLPPPRFPLSVCWKFLSDQISPRPVLHSLGCRLFARSLHSNAAYAISISASPALQEQRMALKESQFGPKGLGGATRGSYEMLTPTLNAAARNAWRLSTASARARISQTRETVGARQTRTRYILSSIRHFVRTRETEIEGERESEMRN